MKTKGFSLVEILVALLLISSGSIIFLKQHLQIHQLQKKLWLRAVGLVFLNNVSERGFAHLPLIEPELPLRLKTQSNYPFLSIDIHLCEQIINCQFHRNMVVY